MIAAEDDRDCEPMPFFGGCSDPTAGGYVAVALMGPGFGTAMASE